MKHYNRAILPIGFTAQGVAAGLKRSGKVDLALFYSTYPAKAACKFTTNSMPAAPLVVDKQHLSASKTFQAIIANSGNANAFTGRQGQKDALEIASCVAKALSIAQESVLVASTGIIGKRLPVSKIKHAIQPLARQLSKQGVTQAAKAILTTDTFSKEITVQCAIGGRTITLCGIAKGAGMIAPNMATMLCFIFTDATITQEALRKALTLAVEDSFNCITVDGCMSTNDSLMLMANGAAGNALISKGSKLRMFSKALSSVCLSLAKMIIQDAEGATKFITIKVKQAKSFTEARQIGLAIANSALCKTAIFGENPNFGRIVAAVGASGVPVREQDISIRVSPLDKKEIFVEVGVKRGKAQATLYTSDLTYEYVKINAEYN
ncbi:MAG: bifunctional glutamate N-acetyltransferase/amino-acid acetyltransferase ArgJ [Candidatus Omnitrophica bacterium]|nr:bifunctional glutamate N-acetyltransferase/amino-acid acetyltransferase ArgJ [Candidatus Omnitrophota bacterium]